MILQVYVFAVSASENGLTNVDEKVLDRGEGGRGRGPGGRIILSPPNAGLF